MASRIMHLAIAGGICQETNIRDINRFKLGIILPDAYSSGNNTAVSHLKTKILGDTKITYKLRYFRETYHAEIVQDDLYLGYYMHLIQDILYRQFVYDKYKWDPMPEGNVDKLHNDYRLLNTYIIEKYNISSELVIPDDITQEKLFDLYPFDLEKMMNGFHNDFIPYREGSEFFFSTNMANEYIKEAISKCVEEIYALKKEKYIIDEEAYAWNAHM